MFEFVQMFTLLKTSISISPFLIRARVLVSYLNDLMVNINDKSIIQKMNASRATPKKKSISSVVVG